MKDGSRWCPPSAAGGGAQDGEIVGITADGMPAMREPSNHGYRAAISLFWVSDTEITKSDPRNARGSNTAANLWARPALERGD